MEHQGILKNSFRNAGSNWNLEMLVCEEKGKPEFSKKNLSEQSREPTTKLNPHMTPGPGIEPGTHWWKANTLTIAPTLLSSKRSFDKHSNVLSMIFLLPYGSLFSQELNFAKMVQPYFVGLKFRDLPNLKTNTFIGTICQKNDLF